jgi:phosphoadenosine phosphosulfate reductase
VSWGPLMSLMAELEELRRAHGDLSGLALLCALLDGGPLAGKTALVSSFGADSAVLLDMVASIDRAIP